MTEELARIIRYTSLDHEDMPGLLSFYEQEKNILHIDREQAERLPLTIRNRLEMTEKTFTKVIDRGEMPTFGDYYVTPKVT